VSQLLHQYFNIAFLMGKPQDLPAGRQQMQIGVALAFVTYVMALVVPYGFSRALAQAILDLGCTALVLYLGLSALGHKARFEQAFGGFCGASTFIHLAALPLFSLRPDGFAGAQGSSVTVLADYVLLVWALSLLGHIIRHTFEVSMVFSIFISFVFFVVLSTLISSILPMQMAAEAVVSGLDDKALLISQWQSVWNIT